MRVFLSRKILWKIFLLMAVIFFFVVYLRALSQEMVIETKENETEKKITVSIEKGEHSA